MWPARPCLSNLVLFDPMKPIDSVDTIVDELAERWSWQESYHKLDFVPRNDVKGHDVKHTFDTLREAPDARPGRLSPRRNSGEEALPWSARREFRG